MYDLCNDTIDNVLTNLLIPKIVGQMTHAHTVYNYIHQAVESGLESRLYQAVFERDVKTTPTAKIAFLIVCQLAGVVTACSKLH